MKTVSMLIGLFALIVMTALPAVDLPSELTGTYVSPALPGVQCDFKAYAIEPAGFQMHVTSVDCGVPGGRVSGARSVYDQCPTTNDPIPIGNTGTQAQFHAYSPSTQQCPLGSMTVTLPGRPTSTFCRIQIIIPTYPYPGCGAASPRPRVRVFGR